MKYALVDLGSNTIRLSVYNTTPEGDFALLFAEKEMAGLVNDVRQGVLAREGIERACTVLENFRGLLGHLGLDLEMHVFATASLRNIRNTEEAVIQIRENTGLEVDVISGELEARLGYLGALRATDLRDGAVFDIGGGSTEVLEAREGQVHRARSLAIGSLDLFNRHVDRVWPKKKELAAIRRTVEKALSPAELPKSPVGRVCGVGGTARAMLKLANDWQGRPRSCRTIAPKELHQLTGLLLERDHRSRRLILHNCPDRLHTILPGAILMDALVERLGASSLEVSPYGVREGYLCHKLMNVGT